jgi:hypothetical protein
MGTKAFTEFVAQQSPQCQDENETQAYMMIVRDLLIQKEMEKKPQGYKGF